MLHTGIDMHKEFLMVTVLDEEGSEVVSPRRIPTRGLCIEEFFSEFEPEEIAAVLEAGPNWYWLCDQLDELGIQNKLCHPLKTRAIASARIKTDKIDSRTLADLSRADLIAESYKPDMQTRYLRELMRGRSFMVNLRTGLKNRVHSILAKINVKNPYSDLFGIGGMGFLKSLALPDVYRDSLDSYLEVIESLNGEIKGAEKKAARARRFALPREVSHWSLSSIQLKLIKIGAKIISHSRMTVFQMAEVAVPEKLFRSMLSRIHRLGRACARAPALSM